MSAWLIIYGLPALFTGWRISGQVAWYCAGKPVVHQTWSHVKHAYEEFVEVREPKDGEVIWGVFCGFLAAFVWPIILPVSLLMGGVGNKLLFCPREYKTALYKRRIYELEQQVGLRA